jgi:hypothetical protein
MNHDDMLVDGGPFTVRDVKERLRILTAKMEAEGRYVSAMAAELALHAIEQLQREGTP